MRLRQAHACRDEDVLSKTINSLTEQFQTEVGFLKRTMDVVKKKHKQKTETNQQFPSVHENIDKEKGYYGHPALQQRSTATLEEPEASVNTSGL